MRTRRLLAVALACFTPLVPRPIRAQTNVEILSRLDSGPPGESYMDVWGYTAPDGTELAILCAASTTLFVDVTNPALPRLVLAASSALSTHRDARTHGEYAYVVNETSGGLEIFDLTDPRRPQQLGSWNESFDSAHNLGIYDGFAYIAGSKKNQFDAGMRILDLSDPIHPVDVGTYREHYVHDVFVRDDIGYLSTIRAGGITVVDLSDKSNPIEIARIPAGSATHNAWLTEDGSYLLTTHEVLGGNIRFWDVTDLQNPRRVAEWSAAPDATVHNVFVHGDSAYASYYAEGIQVLDISEPTMPERVAFLDTRPGVTSGLEGVWGIYPYAASGNVYFSDMQLGLYVVRITETEPQVGAFRLSAPDAQTALPGQVTPLSFLFQISNTTAVDETFSLAFTNSVHWTMQTPQTLLVRARSTGAATAIVHVPESLSEATEVNVEMCAMAKSTREQRCVSTEVMVPVVLQDFHLWHEPGRGVVLEWDLDRRSVDAGTLVLRRSKNSQPRSWQEIARVSLAGRGFVDREAGAGFWAYALLLEDEHGTRMLADGSLHVQPSAGGLRVLGNAPNPFNPVTRIRLEVHAPAPVDVHIYDSRGRLVRRLRATLAPGERSILWDGRDRLGRPQPSGIYVYEVQSRGSVARSRMTLLR